MARRTQCLATIHVMFSLLASCAIRPSEVKDSAPTILLKSVRLPVRQWLPWFARFAEHTWIDFRHHGHWHRVEWDNLDHIIRQRISSRQAFEDERWERKVAVHELFRGKETEDITTKILAVAEGYEHAKHYLPWPGPNSNTFINWLASEVDLPILMPPAAVGKDYTTWLQTGITASKTGVELETMLLGVEVGLREGVEVHFLGLTLGVGFWPPALKLPFLPAIPGGWIAPE